MRNFLTSLKYQGRKGFSLMEIQIGIVIGIGALALGAGWFLFSVQSAAVSADEVSSRTQAEQATREVTYGLSQSTNALGDASGAVSRADPFDLVIRAREPANANEYWLRWCTTATTGTAALRQISGPTVASTGSGNGTVCAGTAGATTKTLVTLNLPTAGSVPVFSYDSSAADQIKIVGMSFPVGGKLGQGGQDKAGSAVVTAASSLQEDQRRPVANLAASGLRPDNVLVLDARKSTDPDGQQLRYSWEVSGLESGIQKFTGARLELDASQRVATTPVICLTVTDSKGLKSSQTINAPTLGQ